MESTEAVMTRTILAIALFAACAPAAAGQAGTASHSGGTQLAIVADVKYRVTMGWGHYWDATVREVLEGKLAQQTFTMSLHSNEDGRRYSGRFQDLRRQENSVGMRFHKLPESPVPLQGFVPSDGTTWEIVDVSPK